ncbi:hypothetical protein M8C21_029516, partial [Ambrosia artemisiifolia]
SFKIWASQRRPESKHTQLQGGRKATDDMSVKPTVALRAMLVGGIAAFAKIAGAAKAAGGVKLGAAAAAVTAAASATMAGSKQDTNQSAK